jgi:outer membrane protein assembly factor BamB
LWADTGAGYLGSAVVGDPEAGAGAAALFLVDAATGAVTVGAGDLPETVSCAAALFEGAGLCAWDGKLHAVDPKTAVVLDREFAPGDGTVYAVGADGAVAVAVGTGAVSGALARGLGPDGEERWAAPISIDGCMAEDPAATSQVVIADGVAKIGVGSYQALLSMDYGALLAAASGRTALAPGGAVGVVRASASLPAPTATSYPGLDGAARAVCDLGSAEDALGVAVDGADAFAVVGEDSHLRLVGASGCADLWVQEDALPSTQIAGADAERVYLNAVAGLTAVDLRTGAVAWRWKPAVGESYRAAAVVEGGPVVALSGAAVTALNPTAGVPEWAIPDERQGAWYWTPPARPGQAARTLVLIGPGRGVLTRADVAVG